MKLIKPSVELIEQKPGLIGIFQQIERAGRLCYKSEDKIVDCIKIDMKDVPENADENFWKGMPNYKENPEETIKWLNEKNIKYDFIESASKFVNMLIEKKHYAMLEHGTVYLMVESPNDENYFDSLCHYKWNPYSTYSIFTTSTNYKRVCVTTNYRVIIENGWEDDLKYLCEPTPYHQKRYTFHFVTSIGITREILRHRHLSFANESTRYCNYSGDKFSNELTFVIPQWYTKLKSNDRKILLFIDSLKSAERVYLDLLKGETVIKKIHGHNDEEYCKTNFEPLKPQEAREVLPMCTKSEIIVTGFESDWIDFLKLRCDKAAHPDMQIIANKAKEFFPAHTY